MLTKEERKEIAERLSSVTKLGDRAFYEAITGEQRPDTTSYEEDLKAMFNVVINLCDTSNMIELPVDKDGEVIRIGDTVYDKDGEEYKVTGYKTLFKDTNIALSNGSEVAYTEKYPHKLTHKRPVTIESLVARIKRVMNDDSTTAWAYDELNDIADQLESLGDSDEA